MYKCYDPQNLILILLLIKKKQTSKPTEKTLSGCFFWPLTWISVNERSLSHTFDTFSPEYSEKAHVWVFSCVVC